MNLNLHLLDLPCIRSPSNTYLCDRDIKDGSSTTFPHKYPILYEMLEYDRRYFTLSVPVLASEGKLVASWCISVISMCIWQTCVSGIGATSLATCHWQARALQPDCHFLIPSDIKGDSKRCQNDMRFVNTCAPASMVYVILTACQFNQIHVWFLLKAFWLMVAWPPSGLANVVILVVDSISELTIHSLYVHPFCVKEMYNTSFIVNLMQQILHSWYRRI